MITISPLEMTVKNSIGQIKKHIAINEVSILRQSRQAASLSIRHGTKNNKNLSQMALLFQHLLVAQPTIYQYMDQY